MDAHLKHEVGNKCLIGGCYCEILEVDGDRLFVDVINGGYRANYDVRFNTIVIEDQAHRIDVQQKPRFDQPPEMLRGDYNQAIAWYQATPA